MKKEEIKKYYCEECGKEMNHYTENAGRYIKEISINLGDQDFVLCYRNFNGETGKENLMRIYECPDRKYTYLTCFSRKIKEGINKKHSMKIVKLF